MDDFLGNMMEDGEKPEAEVVEQPEAEVIQPEPVEQVEEVEQPQPEPEAQRPKEIPFGAMMDERDRRKEAERERDELRKQLEEQSASRSVPDAFDDPEGFARYQEQKVEERIVGMRFEMSDRFARQQHGDDAVQTAIDWASGKAQAEPTFAAQYMGQQDPIGWIVQQHKRDALLSDIGDPSKLDDWFEREAAKRGFAKQSAPEPAAPVVAMQQPAIKPAMPPRSIASDAAAPKDQAPVDERAGFLAAFK